MDLDVCVNDVADVDLLRLVRRKVGLFTVLLNPSHVTGDVSRHHSWHVGGVFVDDAHCNIDIS